LIIGGSTTDNITSGRNGRTTTLDVTTCALNVVSCGAKASIAYSRSRNIDAITGTIASNSTAEGIIKTTINIVTNATIVKVTRGTVARRAGLWSNGVHAGSERSANIINTTVHISTRHVIKKPPRGAFANKTVLWCKNVMAYATCCIVTILTKAAIGLVANRIQLGITSRTGAI